MLVLNQKPSKHFSAAAAGVIWHSDMSGSMISTVHADADFVHKLTMAVQDTLHS